MFEIGKGPDGTIVFSGRLDAAQCAKAEAFIDLRLREVLWNAVHDKRGCSLSRRP